MRRQLSEVLRQPTIQMGPTGSHIPLVVQLESDPEEGFVRLLLDPLRGKHWLRCKATEIHDEVEQLDAEEVRQRKVSGVALFRVWLKTGSIVEKYSRSWITVQPTGAQSHVCECNQGASPRKPKRQGTCMGPDSDFCHWPPCVEFDDYGPFCSFCCAV